MTRKTPAPAADAASAAGMSDWFDPKIHSVGPAGIIETATGTLLADDGLPASTALRLKRERDASTEGVTDAS